jgi:methylase of polypeptide subunit release factors
MTLPEVERCLSLGAEGWGSLGRRLRAIGVTSQAYDPLQRRASNANRVLRSPIVKWHLRRDLTPRAVALRMFAFWDPVTVDEARTALGEELPVDRLLEIGLLAKTADGGVVSQFVLRLVDDLYVFSDDVNVGGEAVMGVGPTTRGLVATARPRGRVRRALDLGCGAGTVALCLAAACDVVVATDISARAVALARINSWLNGITNVEHRVGDLFEPVAGETFDLVVSQPPFVARDEEAPATTFLFGGPRGDELAMALLGRVGSHLTANGRAVLLVEWPMVDGDPPIDQRVRAALGGTNDLSLLVVQWADIEVDDHCARYTLIGHLWQDEAYERDAIRRREHFERARIRALRPTFTLVRRGAVGTVGWTSTMDGRFPADTSPRPGHLDGLFEARDLVARGRDALKAARLRISPGVSFGPPGRDGTVDVEFAPHLLHAPLTYNEAAARLVRAVAEAPRVDQGIARYAAAAGEKLEDFEGDALGAVEEGLLHGVLAVPLGGSNAEG